MKLAIIMLITTMLFLAGCAAEKQIESTPVEEVVEEPPVEEPVEEPEEPEPTPEYRDLKTGQDSFDALDNALSYLE